MCVVCVVCTNVCAGVCLARMCLARVCWGVCVSLLHIRHCCTCVTVAPRLLLQQLCPAVLFCSVLFCSRHRTPTPNAPDEQLDPRSGAGDNTLTPCIYTLELLPRISIHNEIIQAFLSGDTKLGSRMLATAEPDTFTELVDSHGRTVAHYAAYVAGVCGKAMRTCHPCVPLHCLTACPPLFCFFFFVSPR